MPASPPTKTTAMQTQTETHLSQAKSHSVRRQSRNKRHSDPFWDLSDDAIKQPLQPSPSPHDQSRSPSLIADLLLPPLNLLSFLLSLAIVEKEQRQWRLSQHAPRPNSSFKSQFGLKSPEPYQDSEGSTWHPHLSWSRRGVAKQQLNTVFEMRFRVLFALALWTLLGCLALYYSAKRMYEWALSGV